MVGVVRGLELLLAWGQWGLFLPGLDNPTTLRAGHVAPQPQCKQRHTEESCDVPAPQLSCDFIRQVRGKNLLCN